jgi:hypothetical protein
VLGDIRVTWVLPISRTACFSYFLGCAKELFAELPFLLMCQPALLISVGEDARDVLSDSGNSAGLVITQVDRTDLR